MRVRDSSGAPQAPERIARPEAAVRPRGARPSLIRTLPNHGIVLSKHSSRLPNAVNVLDSWFTQRLCEDLFFLGACACAILLS
jgi:hypothetical protein